MTSIGIVGSRRRNTADDLLSVRQALSKLLKGTVRRPVQLVSGGCPKGADSFVADLTDIFGLEELLIHYPDKSKLDPRIPVRAAYAKINYARNTLIARDSDILIACVAPDRKGGTEHTIKEFMRLHPNNQILLV